MNTCPNCGKVAGLHSSILQGCMCQYSMQSPPQRTEQEPVKYSDYEPDGVHHNKPAQRTWVGLTDEEYTHITDTVFHTGQGLVAYYKAIEAKLKEKNT